MLGGDGDEVADAESAEIFGGGFHALRVDFVHGEEEGLAGALEQAGEVEVGGGELGAAIDDHDDGVGFFEGEAGLAEDFGGDLGFVVGDDAAGIDDAGGAALPADFAVDAVAGDAGLVADDGAARAGEAIEEGGFADVGAAHDRKDWPCGQTRLRRKRPFEGGSLLRIRDLRATAEFALHGPAIVARVRRGAGGGIRFASGSRAAAFFSARLGCSFRRRGVSAADGFPLCLDFALCFLDAFAVALDGFQVWLTYGECGGFRMQGAGRARMSIIGIRNPA